MIRPAGLADATAIAEIYRHYVGQTVASFELEAPSADEMERRMVAEPRLPWLVACRDGRVIGYAYASPHHQRPGYRWAVNVSVYLAVAEHRKGTGRALYGELLPILRSLGYVTAIGGITLPNPASVGLHEAMGFVQVGRLAQVGFKQGRWYDVGWWQLSLRDRNAAGEEPREPSAWSPY